MRSETELENRVVSPAVDQASLQHAAAFGHIVTVLMRSAKHRLSFLAELWGFLSAVLF